MQISPFYDRQKPNLPKSQIGFMDYLVRRRPALLRVCSLFFLMVSF